MKNHQNKNCNFIGRIFNLPTIKAKFIVPVSLALVTLFTLLMVGFIKYHNKEAEIKINNDIKMITALETELLTVPLWNYNEEHINEVAQYSFKNKEVVYIKVYDDQEGTELLTRYCRDKAWEITTWNDDGAIDDPYLITRKAYINRIVDGKNHIIGLLEMGFTSKFYQKEKITTALFILLFGTIVFAMVIGLLIIIVNVITHPIQKLTDIVVESSEYVNNNAMLSKIIASSDKLERADIYNNDEIGKLAFAFNNMMKHLRESLENLQSEMAERQNAEEMLKRAYDHQEMLIQERTAKLVKANKELETEIKERNQAEEALRQSERKYRTVLEANPDPVVVCDMDGKVIYFNPAFTRVFGWTLKERFGKELDDFVPEDAWPETQKMIAMTQAGKSFYGVETHRYQKEGNIIPTSISGAIYRDGDGNPLGSIINLRDVSKQKNLEALLQRAQKMEAIGTLAGGVAHDLNNVLSGIVSYPDLLLMQLPEDSPLRKYILTMQASGKKAAAIVQDLLTLARRGVATKQVESLNDIITDYLQSPEHGKLISYHPGVEIYTNLEADLLNISGSRVHLSKTVMNLVSNAAEAITNEGKIFISTKNQYIDKPIKGYESVEEGDYIVLTVSDTGQGISSTDLERIFEPFYTKKVMGRSGTGLGMSVVWGTIKDHNGHIDVQSTEGQGTTFTLYFPVTRREINKEDTLVSIEDYSGNGESILVVDDVKEQRKIALSLLTAMNYEANSVSSGEEAVEYLKKHKVDLVVLDMIMNPGIDGLDTYKKILELHPGQQAIIASGFSETDRVKETQSLGAGQYIQKPYTLEKIGVAVRNELKNCVTSEALTGSDQSVAKQSAIINSFR